MDNVKVIPKVGQVWVRNNNGSEIILTDVSQSGYVWKSSDSNDKLTGTVFEPMSNSFTFLPSSDLEWLALNCSEESIPRRELGDNLNYAKQNNKVVIGDYRYLSDSYHPSDVIEMRIYLGLDEDMNIDNIANEEGVFYKAESEFQDKPSGESFKPLRASIKQREASMNIANEDGVTVTNSTKRFYPIDDGSGSAPPIDLNPKVLWKSFGMREWGERCDCGFCPTEPFGNSEELEEVSMIEIAFNEAVAEYNQLKDVTSIVAAHSHLAAADTGLAIIKYLRGYYAFL